MEYVDVYTRDGKLVRASVSKHDARHAGDYCKHVLVILKTKDSPAPGMGEGQYVVQQRSLKAKYYAGKWDLTGGGVRASESEIVAACREVKEELGIKVLEKDMKPAFNYIQDWSNGTGLFISVFMCRVDVPNSGYDYDPYEVNDVKIMPFNEFYECVMDHNSQEFGDSLKKVENRL
mgnify:CR=1 FL=1